MRDAVALVALVVELPVPLFWLLMHPAAEFWRSRARASYYWMAPAVWAGVALALLVTEFEERELLARLGEDYAEYRRQEPRFLPR